METIPEAGIDGDGQSNYDDDGQVNCSLCCLGNLSLWLVPNKLTTVQYIR